MGEKMKDYFRMLTLGDSFKVFALGLLVIAMLIVVIVLDKTPPDKGNKLSEIDVGEVLDATAAFNLFGQPATVRIETNKVVVFVKGIVSITRGEKAKIKVYDTGLRFLCLEYHTKELDQY